jgi:hypothetical protein
MTKIVHLVPHLGGGIGKALSGIVSKNIKTKKASEHTFIFLELLEKEYLSKKIVQVASYSSVSEKDSFEVNRINDTILFVKTKTNGTWQNVG